MLHSGKRVEEDFLNKISGPLDHYNPDIYYLAGIDSDNQAELILSAEGSLRAIPYVEQLIDKAPNIEGWQFTALKQPHPNSSIKMGNYEYSAENISFSPLIDEAYPDEINLVLVHQELNATNKEELTNGTFIFLDNLLGELTVACELDYLEFVGPDQAPEELIPIEKLPDYLNWRKKEFTEKYEGIRFNTENDEYMTLEGQTGEGAILIAVMNHTLLTWDKKASHPFVFDLILTYDGSEKNGFPDETIHADMNEFEEQIDAALPDVEGYLNLGRQTGDNNRIIHLCCRDFRKPVLVLDQLLAINELDAGFNFTYRISKDKYWQAFDRFLPMP
ncbi:MAG: DUF695 domain-containing protein [Bacteroidota bacterium]